MKYIAIFLRIDISAFRPAVATNLLQCQQNFTGNTLRSIERRTPISITCKGRVQNCRCFNS